MANSDYTFRDVVLGTGSFSMEGDTGYSNGVNFLQQYLRKIGYTINDPSGRFQSGTRNAVIGFQNEMGVTANGIAGQSTCKPLSVVHSSEYFNTYGRPISGSRWGADNILEGYFSDVDLISRVLVVECGYTNINDQKAVAIVIVNRSENLSCFYPEDDYPYASIYARVIAYRDAYKTTISPDCEGALAPARGYHATEAEGYINPGWKSAVDIAKQITEGVEISTTTYVINGTNITSQMQNINSCNYRKYINQSSWTKYVDLYNKGVVSTEIPPLTVSADKKANIIYRW